MTRTLSPLDPRVEVRFVGDQELDVILRELVEPTREMVVLSWEIYRAIGDRLGVGVDEVRVRVAMGRLLESPAHVGAARSGLAFGRIRRDLTGHQRLRIAAARRHDEALARQPRPAPAPAAPAESTAAMIDRLLG